MTLTPDDRVLVTGATGFAGGHVARRLRERDVPVRAVCRPGSDTSLLTSWGVEIVPGDVTDADSLKTAAAGVTAAVHCAAKVGDWGPVDAYRRVNVDGTRNLLDALHAAGGVRRFVHLSSLGVYPARDHHGTDESAPIAAGGIDGYTVTKAESERLVRDFAAEHDFPAVVLRPGFIYGPRDRTVLPKLIDSLRTGRFRFLGDGEQLLNQIHVDNLVDAVELALNRADILEQPPSERVYNLTDGRLVTRREFVAAICEPAGIPLPTRTVPLPVARGLARVMEGTWRLLGKGEAPLLSHARVKFLGLNLDFSIDRAKRELGYAPRVSFADGMGETMAWALRS